MLTAYFSDEKRGNLNEVILGFSSEVVFEALDEHANA